jgi:hypothetical protein
MRYGSEEETKVTDDKGSTETLITKYRNYEVSTVVKKYEHRIRVRNETEELEEFLSFQKQKVNKLHPEFKIERTATSEKDGCYYVVKIWSERVQ